MVVRCKFCGNIIYRKPRQIKKGNLFFCNRICYYKYKKISDKKIEELRNIYKEGYTILQTAKKANVSYQIVFKNTREMSRGRKGYISWNKGILCKEETKQKISNTLKQNYKTGKMVNWNKGLTKETDLRLKKKSELYKGFRHSEETKRKMSISRKGKKQKSCSEEAKINMSKVRKGKTYEELYGVERAKEIKKKVSESLKGRKFTDDWKDKISKAHLNKIVSQESRLKMSKSKKGKMMGENNPAWQEGKSFEPYSSEFNNKFKRAIRKRDNQICMLCGIHREKLKRALSVHHVNYDKKLTIPQNCICLCDSCHSRTNYNRKHWIKFFQDLLKEKYNYEYSNEGEVILSIKPLKIVDYGK